MVELNLKHIYKHYDNAEDDQYSVTDFNLDIKDREFIVFVGPSGCGKSTTLRMIAGLEDISKGEFLIDGRVVNDEAPKDRDIAMVFQNYALYPHMTVYDNMAFGLKLRKYDKEDIDKRVHHAAKILGLEEYLQRKPAALSGGQRQRVALGRAIVRDAPIFLMDEPLSNLDAKLRVSMRAEIAKLHQQLKTTTIYVTHDQTEAMTMADRIVVMRDGKIQQVGTPQEVYDHPANVFVGGFIGSPAMNFFKVTLKDGKATVHASRVLCVPPVAGDPELKVKTDAALDESGGRELSILVNHRYPCLLSVSIVDENGKTVRRLTSYQPTRPQQLTPDGSFFYWSGKLADGSFAAPGKYAVKVTAYINDTAYESISEPFSVLETP